MRISHSLALILAVITMANAAVVDSVVQPKHKLARVKNSVAHVNAINTAKVNANLNKVDVKNLDLQHVASVADVDALGAAHAGVKTVDLKHVAGIVHTLSASLESHDSAADSILKLKDHKLAAKKVHKLLGGIKTDLAHAVVDIHGLTKVSTAGKTNAVNVGVLRRGFLQGLNLETVVDSTVHERSELLSGVDGAVSGVTSAVELGDVLGLVKRELLQSVDGTISGVRSSVNLDEVLALVKRAELLSNVEDAVSDTVSGVTSTVGVERVLNLKQALAYISALPGSDLVSIDQAVKRALIEDVDLDSVLDNVNVGLLKRSILDLSSVVNTHDVDGLVDDVLKRNVLSGILGTANVGNTASGALGGVEGIAGYAAGSAVGSVKHGIIAPVEQDINPIDLNRIISLKRSAVLSSVGDTVSDVDLASVLPALKHNLLAADANFLHTVDYTTLHARHTAGALLTDSVHSLLCIVSKLLDKVVHITDVVHVDAVTKDVKGVVVPLVAAVGKTLDSVVTVKVPGLYGEVEKILCLAKKVVESLP